MSGIEDRLRDAMAVRARMVPDEDRPLPAPRDARRAGVRAAAVALAVAATAVGVVRLSTSSPEAREEAAGVMTARDTTVSDPPDVSIYLCTEVSAFPRCEGGAVTAGEKEKVRRMLAARPEVRKVVFEDRRTAWENFRRDVDPPEQVKDTTLENMVESFRVWLEPGADPASVARAASALPGVSNSVMEACLRNEPETSATDRCGFTGVGRA